MPKQSRTAEISNFVGGLITEASPLTFPPNASVDEDNFVLNRDGTRDRRLGMDFEDNFALAPTGYTAAALAPLAISTFRWDNVAEENTIDFIVMQFGNRLHIYDAAVDDITADGLKEVVILTLFDGRASLSFASVDGKLVIAGGKDFVWVLSFSEGVFTQTTQRLLVRDLWGIDDPYSEAGSDFDLTFGNEVSRRPQSLSDAHLYNLRNQSFGKVRRIESTDSPGDPISEVFSIDSRYPSNADVLWSGMGFEDTSGNIHEEFDGALMIEANEGTSASGKGSFIIDALRRGESRGEEMEANDNRETALSHSLAGTLPLDTTPGGATQVAEFAGRIFYAGFSGEVTDGDSKSPKLSSYLLFSKLVDNPSDIGSCFQEGDPTSRSESDILATDGGFLRVSGMNRCVKMVALSNKLVIIATNGVWLLTGGSDFGFAADNFLVTKVAEFGALGSQSVTEVGSELYYWATNGIYHLGPDQFGEFKAQNITQTTIQTLYDDLSTVSKEASVGLYDKYSNKIRWLFDIKADLTEDNTPTRELILDLNLQAFYLSTIGNLDGPTPFPVAMVETPPFRLGAETFDIIVNGNNVVVQAVDAVVITEMVRTTGTRSIKYVTVIANGAGSEWTLSSYRDTAFEDWNSFAGTGIDAPAFLLTGTATAGQANIDKQIPYLTMFFHKTETGFEDVGGDWVPIGQSSCIVQSRWDWSDSAASGRWSREFEAYRHNRHFTGASLGSTFDNGFALVVSKSKLRGKGKAFSLFMKTAPKKDCRIIGWDLAINSNSLV